MRFLKWLAIGLVVGALLAGGYMFYRSRTAAPPATPSALQPTATQSTAPQSSAELTFVAAPIAQADGTAELVPATARFMPAQEGEEVVLQRRTEDGWTDEATAVQDAEGVATFAVPVEPEEALRFRVVPADDPEAKSSTVRIRVREPIFKDDFDGTDLDPDKWRVRQVGIRAESGKRACAESDESVVSIAEGAAVLEVAEIPKEEAELTDEVADCPHGEYYNGHIGTQGNFRFRYGIMAARIKFPSQQGQHGAFWSQPDGDTEGGSEIDVVEYFGDDFPAKGELSGSHALQHSIYWEDEDGPHKVGGLFDVSDLLPDNETWSDDFHVYSVEWTPTEYIFRVDGHETFRTSEGVSDVKQYLILSLLTSDWELPRLDTSDLTPMEIDWVRVWRTPEATGEQS